MLNKLSVQQAVLPSLNAISLQDHVKYVTKEGEKKTVAYGKGNEYTFSQFSLLLTSIKFRVEHLKMWNPYILLIGTEWYHESGSVWMGSIIA